MHIFVELADNGPLSCIKVVGVKSRKWGHFGVLPVRAGALLVLTGWWVVQEISAKGKGDKRRF